MVTGDEAVVSATLTLRTHDELTDIHWPNGAGNAHLCCQCPQGLPVPVMSDRLAHCPDLQRCDVIEKQRLDVLPGPGKHRLHRGDLTVIHLLHAIQRHSCIAQPSGAFKALLSLTLHCLTQDVI